MNDTKNVVVCLLKNAEGKYLMTLPSSYKNYGEYQDAWCFPAGHIKKDESQEEALIRELKEELNVDIEPVKLISEWQQDVPGETAFWWECSFKSGELTLSHEISKFAWFSGEEIKSLKIWPAMEKFLTRFVWK
jgi:8-oxo-dGTP diphosphatase